MCSFKIFISSVTGITSNVIQSSAKKAGKHKRKGENEDVDISQQKSQSNYNDNNKVLLHISLPIHQAIRAIKKQYLSCSIKMKWKQL